MTFPTVHHSPAHFLKYSCFCHAFHQPKLACHFLSQRQGLHSHDVLMKNSVSFNTLFLHKPNLRSHMDIQNFYITFGPENIQEH